MTGCGVTLYSEPMHEHPRLTEPPTAPRLTPLKRARHDFALEHGAALELLIKHMPWHGLSRAQIAQIAALGRYAGVSPEHFERMDYDRY